MRHITKVRLQNFQSYVDETIVLDPGLNLLVGTSDSGKSAILRAISFVMHNHPKKDSLIHWGATETRVTLEFNDGVSVTRIKGVDRNAIEAKDSTGKKHIKEKIDKEIPDDIKELLGNPPQDDINGFISYAEQFASKFLIDLSPTDLPRALSNLTGIEILESTAKQLMQSSKALEKQNKADESEYNKLVAESEAYSHIDDYEVKIATIQKHTDFFNSMLEDLEELEKIDTHDIPSVEAVDIFVQKIDRAVAWIARSRADHESIHALEAFNLEYCNTGLLGIAKNVIDNADRAENDIKKLTKICIEINELEKIQHIYQDIKKTGQTLSEEYKLVQEEIKDMEKELAEYKEFLVREKIQCEVCGSVIK